MALSVDLGNGDSAAKTFAGLRTELAKEKAAREKAEAKNETLARRLKIERRRPTCLLPKSPL
jgi:hypothetical protein